MAEGTPFEELPAALPTERFALGGDDPTLGAIVHLTPIGKGSRVTIAGPSFAGKSEALRLLALALQAQEGVDVSVVLAGVRPEELAGWSADGIEPQVALSFWRPPTPEARPWTAPSTPPAARRPAAATPCCSSTRSTACPPSRRARRWALRARSPTAAR